MRPKEEWDTARICDRSVLRRGTCKSQFLSWNSLLLPETSNRNKPSKGKV